MAISDETTTKKTTKTVHLNNSEKYFRKLDNKTLRLKIPGEERVTAKDILLDALTCEENWLFTTKNIAIRWGIPEKRATNKLILLSKSGYAKPCKIVDPKDNKILMHYWIFYENPHSQKREYGENDINVEKQNEILPKSHTPKNGTVVPIIEKEQRKKKQQQPEPDPAVCSVVDFLHNNLKQEYRKSLKKDLIKEAIEKHRRTKPQLEKLIEQINSVTDLKSAGAYFRNVAFNENNDLPIEPQPEIINVREKAKKDQIEYEKSIDYEPISVEEMRRIRADSCKQQSLTKPPSVQNPPINPKKNMAFKERKEIFLSKVDSSLHEYYLNMSDYELQNRSEFQTHAY